VSTPYDEQSDLDLVAAYLATRGLSAERFSREETLIGKTPDFRVHEDGAIVAYCEVKSPQDDTWLDDCLRVAPPETIVGGARTDPTFKRLARHLRTADLQFSAVNPSRTELNILAYVNHEDTSRYADLHETLTGYFHTSDGKKIPTVLQITQGIEEAIRRIDAFLWFESATRNLGGLPIINDADPERMRRVRALLFD
jgi:hypothetical protein